MKKLLLLGSLASCLVLGGISLNLRPREVKNEVRDATIIVKLDENVSRKATLNKIRNIVTPNIEVKSEYSRAFNGFTIEVPSQYVSDIRYLYGVEEIDYDKVLDEYSFGDGAVEQITPQAIVQSTASSKTMSKPEGTNDGSGTFIAILDTAFYLYLDNEGAPVYHHVYSPLASQDVYVTQDSLLTKINAAETFHGKPDDEHSTYFNSKVPFYYDYGGNNQTSAIPDYDVYDEGQSHGTHVSSIAGGNAGEEYEGMAPRSQMALMKVFSTYMNGQEYGSRLFEAALLNALEDCLVLDVDVINMSLGSNLDDFSDAEIAQQLIAQLEDKGTFVCVAAGNSGKGEWSGTALRYFSTDVVETNIISSYANNMKAMTVASTQADSQFYGAALMVDGVNIKYEDEVTNYKSTSGDVVYDPERHLSDIVKEYDKSTFDFVKIGGYGEEKDYKNVDVAGKIAVVDRGESTFRDKVEQATTAGAAALIVINNEENVTEFKLRMSFGDDKFTPDIPVCFVLYENRDNFINAESKICRIVQNEELPNPDTRTVSDYSSDGMKYDLSIKPEISTPGENIKGAIPGAVDKYESMSGTSMATPNYAGAVSVMISNHLGDDDYRQTINARMMSTANPMHEGNVASNTHISVRRQGAGLVNLDAAINSEVYLDGLDESGNRLYKAKVELKNNEDIKSGKLNLKFAAINEGNDTITYTATTYVYCAEIVQYDEEAYPELAGSNFQSNKDHLLEFFEDTVTIAPGVSEITIPEHELNADSKNYLAQFDYGAIVEGFVVLTAENKAQLSVPFLGYYGELEDASPVEPFTFEREEGRVYSSDTLNYFLRVSLISNDYRKANYNSMMLGGYFANYKKVNFDNAVVNNKASLDSYSDDNGKTLTSVCYNPYTGKYDQEAIFMGNNGSSANMLVIQQYVIRSCATNEVTITKKSNGEKVYTTNLEDTIFGPDSDGNPNTPDNYPLYKSHFDYTTLYEQGYMAHRAYGVVPVYSLDANKKIVPFADGEYELTFSYHLAAGSVYEKKYDLIINSDTPVIDSIEEMESGGKTYARLSFKDPYLNLVTVNDNRYSPVQTANGSYVDVDKSAAEFASDDTAFIQTQNLSFATDSFITRLNDKNNLMIRHNLMNGKVYSYNYTVENEGSASQTYTFKFTKNGVDYSPKGDVSYTMLVPEGLDADSLKLYTINASGAEKELKFTKNGSFISFSTGLRSIRFASNGSSGGGEGGEPVDPPVTPDKPSGGCGGYIATTSIILSAAALLGVILIVAKKARKE